jgi:hypothetical protein
MPGLDPGETTFPAIAAPVLKPASALAVSISDKSI